LRKIPRKSLTVAGLLAAVALGAGGTAQAVSAVRPPSVRGIDVSSYQHPGGAGINWRSVAHYGYKFAFIKDTEGTYYVNPYYASDLRGAQAHGLKVGSYAFANPSQSSGSAQARYLLSHGGFKAGMLAPVLDIEWNPQGANCYGLSPASMVSWVASFENTIHSRTGVWATINTPSSWWNACTGRSHAFGNRPLWDENNHHSTPSSPVLPAGWTTWSYWQYSITGHIPGVPGTVDLNKTN
jgi:GH25 family lysozyme M1 (1,4-beta-N-acetylmuramidase)